MPYEDIFIAHVLNYWLADGFDASEETDVLEWLGEGKTFADMFGEEVAASFYTPERVEQIHSFISAYDLLELQYYLNDNDRLQAVVLELRGQRELAFKAGNPAGVPAISTEWFARHRAEVLERTEAT